MLFHEMVQLGNFTFSETIAALPVCNMASSYFNYNSCIPIAICSVHKNVFIIARCLLTSIVTEHVTSLLKSHGSLIPRETMHTDTWPFCEFRGFQQTSFDFSQPKWDTSACWSIYQDKMSFRSKEDALQKIFNGLPCPCIHMCAGVYINNRKRMKHWFQDLAQVKQFWDRVLVLYVV